jgi:hypothetical protein
MDNFLNGGRPRRHRDILNLVTDEKVAAIAGISPLPALSDEIVLRRSHDAFSPTRLDQNIHWRADSSNAALKRFPQMLSLQYARLVPGT